MGHNTAYGEDDDSFVPYFLSVVNGVLRIHNVDLNNDNRCKTTG